MTTSKQNPEIEKLKSEIEIYREESGMTKTGFGLWAINDPNLIRDLEKGRDLRWQTIAAIREKMLAGDNLQVAE